MKYSPSFEVIMAMAVNEAVAGEFKEILPEHMLIAIVKFSELNIRILENIMNIDQAVSFLESELQELKKILRERNINSTKSRRALRMALGKGGQPPKSNTVHRSGPTKKLFTLAELAGVRDGLDTLTPGHFLVTILDHPTALISSVLGLAQPARAIDAAPVENKEKKLDPQDMGGLTVVLKELRGGLLERVFGQDHAVHAFVEGLFNAEVVAAADTERKKPKALFVFAGPPGVGKTYLAESGAQALGRSFKRFDMSGYSDSMGVIQLCGAQRSYQAAKAGQLTEFVEQNPQSILLFDEIEKADISVIHLFLQLLDNGSLEDKFTETNVNFKDTIIIFTTNAGRSLYDDPNSTGVSTAQSSFHRKTILNALENEVDPRTRRPFFPQAICSRMATGYPIMFNRLGVNELEKIAHKEFLRTGELLKKQYHKDIECGRSVPICLVMREGARTDARTVRAQTEIFIKTELFKFSSLYNPERFKDILDRADRILFDLDTEHELEPEIASLLNPQKKPCILLAVQPEVGRLWTQRLKQYEIHTASDLGEALNLLGAHDFDFVLLDLWFDQPEKTETTSKQPLGTAFVFDHVPVASKSIRKGQELLRTIHERYPELPCYLLTFRDPSLDAPSVDEELLFASIRSGGARGLIETAFFNGNADIAPGLRDLMETLDNLAHDLHRARQAAELASQSKVISFDTAPMVTSDGRVVIRFRNLRIIQAVASDDVSAMVQDAERPSTRFADVYGADQAKGELQYIINWLKDPRQFQNMGLRPPKGILLYGPPGTGKTMLARALAGESNVTFIVESATNFVTKWVGSGPENVRNLFARARRYAPSILFIDEIDAVGRKRSADSHARAQEETLNAILTEMDGFGAPTAKPAIVLAATNLVETLDDALKRRFDREIEVDKPDRAARMAYMVSRLQGGPSRQVSDPVIERLAGQSAGMTIAQLERVIQFAGRKAAMSDGVITNELIEEAFETMRMGEAKGQTDPVTLLRVARHEAGHCLIGWLRGEKPVQITIVARGRAGGYVEREADEDRMLSTLPELEGSIRQTMGGRAAEILYYGETDGMSTGVSGDLRNATQDAEKMVRDYGMGDGIGNVYIDRNRLRDGPLAIKVMEEAQKIVQKQLDLALDELNRHKAVMDRLVNELMLRNRLTRDELELILGDL